MWLRNTAHRVCNFTASTFATPTVWSLRSFRSREIIQYNLISYGSQVVRGHSFADVRLGYHTRCIFLFFSFPERSHVLINVLSLDGMTCRCYTHSVIAIHALPVVSGTCDLVATIENGLRLFFFSIRSVWNLENRCEYFTLTKNLRPGSETEVESVMELRRHSLYLKQR